MTFDWNERQLLVFFEKFQDIEIELSVPPEITMMNTDGTQAEVKESL